MASVHIAAYVDMRYMFNISAGVGRGRANQRLDVMLIQYLLSLARNTTVHPGGSSTRRIVPPELANDLFKLDGICGPKTLRYIEFYQQFRNSHNQHSAGNDYDIKVVVKADGAIDPWAYPAEFNFVHRNNELLNRTSTLVTLCYDATQSHEFQMGSFESMPAELRRVLMAH